MPMRTPALGLPRLANSCCTRSMAAGVTVSGDGRPALLAACTGAAGGGGSSADATNGSVPLSQALTISIIPYGKPAMRY
jgi:nicotinamide mononucleotide (NMN) deamidase PncC